MTPQPRTIHPVKRLAGTIHVPGDKSCSHRALLLAACAQGESVLRNLNPGADVAATLEAIRALGAETWEDANGALHIRSGGTAAWRSPDAPINCGNSGTTARLLMALCAAQPGLRVKLTGDASLARRPMDRVASPLRMLGARIWTTDGHLPVEIEGTRLSGGELTLQVPSAQVKSALLLAGLFGAEPLELTNPYLTRDHTERLLSWLARRSGGLLPALRYEDPYDSPALLIQEPWTAPPSAFHWTLPGDPSAAANWTLAALIHPSAEVILPGVCDNLTRFEWSSVLRARDFIEMRGEDMLDAPERACTIRVWSNGSFGAEFETLTIRDPALLIDELPLLALVATQLLGTTVMDDLRELRLKESDRLAGTAAVLSALGADIEVAEEGWVIRGPTRLRGGFVKTRGDHRLALLGAMAALGAAGPVTLDDADCIAISDPGALSVLESLGALKPLC